MRASERARRQTSAHLGGRHFRRALRAKRKKRLILRTPNRERVPRRRRARLLHSTEPLEVLTILQLARLRRLHERRRRVPRQRARDEIIHIVHVYLKSPYQPLQRRARARLREVSTQQPQVRPHLRARRPQRLRVLQLPMLPLRRRSTEQPARVRLETTITSTQLLEPSHRERVHALAIDVRRLSRVEEERRLGVRADPLFRRLRRADARERGAERGDGRHGDRARVRGIDVARRALRRARRRARGRRRRPIARGVVVVSRDSWSFDG